MKHFLPVVAFLLVVSAQPSPRRRSPPPPRRRSPPPVDSRRRTVDDRRRYVPPDDRRRYVPPDDRRRYVPPAPPPPQCYVPNCVSCLVSPHICYRCLPGYTRSGLVPGSNCLPCSSRCISCDRAGWGDCDQGKCVAGYGNRRNGAGCGACTGHCRSCLVSGADNCDAGKCDSGYTNDGTRCSSCSSWCASCDSAGPGRCDACQSAYFLDKDKTCKACAKNCQKCNDASDEGCTSCAFGYIFNRKHKCVRSWMINLIWMIPAGVAVCCLLGFLVKFAADEVRSWLRNRRRAANRLLPPPAPAREIALPSDPPQIHGQQAEMSIWSRAATLLPSALSGGSAPILSVPSGIWRGYYTYNGRNHDVCEFQLQFDNGAVQGRGVDDVGGYTIRGRFDGQSIRFTKQYQIGTPNQAGFVSEDNEGHAVAYTGRLVGQNLGAGFRGSWCIRNRGTNSDGVFHLWHAMDSWASASAPSLEEPTPQVFQVAEDGECVVCLDQAITTCLRPCGHIAMCSQCADRLRRSTGTCPICRAPIQSVMTMQNGEVYPNAAQALRT